MEDDEAEHEVAGPARIGLLHRWAAAWQAATSWAGSARGKSQRCIAAVVDSVAAAARSVLAGIQKPFRAAARHVAAHATFYVGVAVGAALVALLAGTALALAPGARSPAGEHFGFAVLGCTLGCMLKHGSIPCCRPWCHGQVNAPPSPSLCSHSRLRRFTSQRPAHPAHHCPLLARLAHATHLGHRPRGGCQQRRSRRQQRGQRQRRPTRAIRRRERLAEWSRHPAASHPRTTADPPAATSLGRAEGWCWCRAGAHTPSAEAAEAVALSAPTHASPSCREAAGTGAPCSCC